MLGLSEGDAVLNVEHEVDVALLVITDGRDDYLTRAVTAANRKLLGVITERWMYDDTGDLRHRADLAERYPGWRVIGANTRQGASGAVRAAWAQLRAESKANFVFHLEDDFVLTRIVDLRVLIQLLNTHPHIAQVVLRRSAVSPLEIAAGGVVEQHPDWYIDCADDAGYRRLEHRAYWTNNPCLYRRSILSLDWPEHVPGRYGEDTFHRRLLAEGTAEVPGDQVTYAYWGARNTGVWAKHIGTRRSPRAGGY